MNRRDALRRTGLVAGAALIPSVVAPASGAAAPPGKPEASAEKRPWYQLGIMADPVLDDVLLFYLSAAWQQQSDIGEVLETASRIEKGQEWSWPREWTRTADRLREAGAEARRDGHRRSAGELLMRASTYYRAALHRWPRPDDPRMPQLTQRSVAAFDASLELLELPAERVEIPYERTTLPGYMFHARSSNGERLRRAPLLIIHEGRDAWAADCLFLADAANQRGYHCLLFDGPGQGATLRLKGLPLRADWERVVTPVVDFAVAAGGVDPRRIALMGLSMGGALAPRAAAHEHRLKAVIANPGVYDWHQNVTQQMSHYLGEKLMALLASDPAAFDARVSEMMRQNAFLRWAVVDVNWKHGVRSPSELMTVMRRFDYRADHPRIAAHTLVMDGTADPYAQGKQLYRAVKAPKDYMLFTARDTGLTHCQNGALGISSQRVLDWLDDTL